MLQDLLADPVRILQIKDNTGIVLQLIFFVDKLLCSDLLAVNDGIEREFLVNGQRIVDAIPPGEILHFPDVALAWINRIIHRIWTRCPDTAVCVNFLLDIPVELLDIVHPPTEHLPAFRIRSLFYLLFERIVISLVQIFTSAGKSYTHRPA